MQHIQIRSWSFVVVASLFFSSNALTQDLSAAKVNPKPMPAKKITYSNKKSGLKATSVQAALDEVGTSLSAMLAGKSRGSTVSSKASVTTTWEGKRYFYLGRVEGSFGPAETLQEAPVTITFTPLTDTAGTLTVTPVNFVCELDSDLLKFPQACGTYGDIFSYSYRIFGNNLFVENPRTSSGKLIGEGVIVNVGAGKHLDIQAQGPQRLVLKFTDGATTIWDLARTK